LFYVKGANEGKRIVGVKLFFSSSPLYALPSLAFS